MTVRKSYLYVLFKSYSFVILHNTIRFKLLPRSIYLFIFEFQYIYFGIFLSIFWHILSIDKCYIYLCVLFIEKVL